MADQLRVATIATGRHNRSVPNTILFPKELRDAIPPHSHRVLEFDRVSAAPGLSWVNAGNAAWLGAQGYDVSAPRVRLSFLAHETGRLTGAFEIGLDLDAETLRAMGQFFIDCADRAAG